MNLVLALALISLQTIGAPVPMASPSPEAAEVASDYLDAVAAGDLDRAGELFADDSIIFESGGREGTWQEYRDHHLGAEIDAIEKFEIRRCMTPKIDSSADGSLSAVAWPIEYTIELREGRTIDSRGTVTFVLERNDDSHRITQLHWSSRPNRSARTNAASAEQAADRSPDLTDGVSKDEALMIARGEFEFVICRIEAEPMKDERDRAVWKVILQGTPAQPGRPIGEYGEVLIDSETGRIVAISRT